MDGISKTNMNYVLVYLICEIEKKFSGKTKNINGNR